VFQSNSQTLNDFNEAKIIENIQQWLGDTSPESPLGIGDDCAVVPPEPSAHSLISTDALVLGKHFDHSITAEQAGQKLVLRNLSDIAAMGGYPKYATLSILSGSNLSFDWLHQFYQGIKSTSDAHDLKIIGGDLCQLQDDQFQAVMTIIGTATQPVLRHAASIKDSIYVTGQLGGSILEKHYNFQPRLSEGQWLAENSLASAMVDITDGIAKELKVLTDTSASIQIDLKAIPIAESAHLLAEKNSEHPLEKAFCDGEDYELLFTLKHSIESTQFEADWKHRFPQTPLTKIGTVIERNPLADIIDSETQTPIDNYKSFDHFNRE
jgi:thiamine-monophosphate kinase